LRVFENRVLREYVNLSGRECPGCLGKTAKNDESHNLYSSPNNITVIKSRRMRWAGHVARIGTIRSAYKIVIGKPEGKRQL